MPILQLEMILVDSTAECRRKFEGCTSVSHVPVFDARSTQLDYATYIFRSMLEVQICVMLHISFGSILDVPSWVMLPSDTCNHSLNLWAQDTGSSVTRDSLAMIRNPLRPMP